MGIRSLLAAPARSATESGSVDQSADLLAAADRLAGELATDVVERDRAGRPPVGEVERLRAAGLLPAPVPAEFGGPGHTLADTHGVVRRLARVDGGTATLLGYHYERLRQLIRSGSGEYADRADRIVKQAVSENWYVGGAGSAQDDDFRMTRVDGGYLVSGVKGFSTGGQIADRLVGAGATDDEGPRLRFVADPRREGLIFPATWDNLGQRLTASGPIEFTDYFVPDEWIIGTWPRRDPEDTKAAERAFADDPQTALGVPGFQLLFVNLYIGFAEGALLAAADYTRTKSRAWVHATVDSPTQDPYILNHYGELVARVQAASALADTAIEALTWGRSRGADLTRDERGEVAALIASAKIISTQVALDATARVFDVTGARATSNSIGLDRFWREARTHSLHDPVAYKLREVGTYFLNGEAAVPSAYT